MNESVNRPGHFPPKPDVLKQELADVTELISGGGKGLRELDEVSMARLEGKLQGLSRMVDLLQV